MTYNKHIVKRIKTKAELSEELFRSFKLNDFRAVERCVDDIYEFEHIRTRAGIIKMLTDSGCHYAAELVDNWRDKAIATQR